MPELPREDVEAIAQNFIKAMQPLVAAITAAANVFAAWVRSLLPELIEALLEEAQPVPLTTGELRELCAGAGTDGAAVRFDSEGGWRYAPSEN